MPNLNIPGYQIKAHIGSGGMAVVFLAEQESLQRPVALKVLKSAESKEFTERFLNEGRILASLSHRNIITVHDIGIHEGHIYISMEYLEGGDLKLRIDAGMKPKEALELLATIGEALQVAHKKGVIHRDVKPGNILFRQDGTPVMADFGIAKEFERDTDITVDGTVVGTPDYLAPEQARIEPLDGRTDIYALGIIFYEMLVGKKPFEGASPVDIVFKHLNDPIPPLPEEFAMYQPLLDKMTAKEPDDRFADAREMLATVTELRVNNAVGGLQKEGRQKHRRKTDDKPRMSGKAKFRWALAAVLVLACGLVYLQRAAVVPFVESYTGPLVDERGVMVDQKDSAVGRVLGWWELAAPYFSWKAADSMETQRIRCRRQGRPDCDTRFPVNPSEDALAGNAPATAQ
ncbi:MAG: protein kinase [Gammaproteobacteria bacterium]|nr:protein kinase [Gammaproteobacteria bacterium]NIN37818.1 protein kinase [Gammaproteobacteria bacterium]NIO23478.1 protein kinase [Gammaproteobacteria bacterium]NIO64094.1 protein kinase [Gammaproteobacteria bacterium]NIP47044.1 serine/threonine protein kinase [Gammaproteobacteria bacterium]